MNTQDFCCNSLICLWNSVNPLVVWLCCGLVCGIALTGEWYHSWSYNMKAVTFACLHWLNELKKYFNYMLRNFNSMPTSHVGSVDQAIQKWVLATADLTLMDFSSFFDLHTQFLSSKGADATKLTLPCWGRGWGFNGGQRWPLNQSVQWDEPCGRWNCGLLCNVNSCIFWHACEWCGVTHWHVDCQSKGGKKGEEWILAWKALQPRCNGRTKST